MSKPTIRVLHHLARSGGTLICRCLGSMREVALLSEIHPRGMHVFNPLRQAMRWHGLVDERDIARLRRRPGAGFNDAIELITKRAAAKRRLLVIRDWTHLDYVGVPFVAEPPFRLTTAETLAERFEVIHTVTVRHPIDQWLSLRRLELVQNRLTLERYLEGCRRFADEAVRLGFVRYEDFVRDPDGGLRVLCERLRVAFDPGYRERWADYRNITGDDPAVEGRAERDIRPLPRRPMEEGLLEAFLADPNYEATCELLGYDARPEAS